MAETEQYKVRLYINTIERLNELADRFGRKSGNQIAAEIIELYLRHWEEAEGAKFLVVEQQRLSAQ